MPPMFCRRSPWFSPCHFALLAILCVAVPALHAETLEHLYDAAVPVADQGDSQRRQALVAALDQVLVRITGQEEDVLRANGVLQAERQRPEDYLLEYRYAKREAPATGAAKAGRRSPAVEPTMELVARFSPESLRQLLTRAGLPLWPRQRPALLVWWQGSASPTGAPQLLPSDNLKQLAQRRGLPLMLPMNDTEDKLEQEALWRLDGDALARLAERYGIRNALAGRALPLAGGGWQGQWLFRFEGQAQVLPAADAFYEAGTLEELESQVLSDVIRLMLLRYAVDLAAPGGQVELVVSGVGGYEAYGELTRQVQSLEAVRSASLQRVEQRTLYYQVSYDGSLPVLQALLGQSSRLQAEALPSDPASSSAVPAVLRYRFVRP